MTILRSGEIQTGHPQTAEQVRSVLDRAMTAEVSWLDGEFDQITTMTRDLVIEAVPAGPGARPVLIEFADAAPLPVRERIRSRVRISGHAVAEPSPTGEDGPLRLHPVSIALTVEDETVPVQLDEFRAAQPDPLSQLEGALLSHVDAAHPEVLEMLTLLLSPRLLQGVVRAWPLALDQHAITLRLESASSHHDVRLPFPAPAGTALEVRHRLSAMLAEAHTRRGRRRVS